MELIHKILQHWVSRNCQALLGKVMAPHSSTLAWKIPWMEEPGRLQSMGSWRVGHDWVTSLSLFTSCLGEGNGNPLQCSCLENPRDGGAWWAAIYGVAQSRTRLKQLSSNTNRESVKHFALSQRLMKIISELGINSSLQGCQVALGLVRFGEVMEFQVHQSSN